MNICHFQVHPFLLFFVVTASCFVLSSTPPVFPEQFIATFSGVNPQGGHYTGTMYYDFINQFDRQDSAIAGVGDYDYIDRYDVKADYNYCSWIPQCVKWMLIATLRRWEVPASSDYLGKVQIGAYDTDHWKYSWSSPTSTLKETDDFYVWLNKTSGNWQPIRNVYWWSNSGTTTVNWLDFSPVQPNPTVFQVPSSWGCDAGTASSWQKEEKSEEKRSESVLRLGEMKTGCPPS